MMIFLLKNIKFFFSNLLVIKHNLKYIIPSNLGKILYPLKTWHFYSIANEVIDSWQKRKEKGLICKLDIEKAYDSINWKFLLKILQKMGFGSKWLGWMWSCIFSAKFSMLVNGVSAGLFPSTKGLRQGDPLSPYLFVIRMEVLDVLIRRAVEGGFLSGCNSRGGSRSPLNISHLFFVDDTIVFCEARKKGASNSLKLDFTLV